MNPRNFDNTQPSQLASIVDLNPSAEKIWQPGELAAILRHQLSLPVRFDAAAMRSAGPIDLTTLASGDDIPIDSFADLLAHADPPVGLLVKLKDFAKSCAGNDEAALPSEVAKVLYFLAIAAARVQLNQRITTMSDAELRDSLRWASALPWVEPRERSLLERAARRLDGSA